jgi:glycosyltransferase involved in cell wall biosynthesis
VASQDHQHRAVAVVLHEPLLGGATTSLLRVLPELERRGWRFSFWVPGRGAAETELRRRGYEVASAERLLRFSLPSLRQPPGPARRLAGLPAYLRGFRSWVSGQEATLVHANTLLALPEVAVLPRRGPPLVLHTHEMLPEGPKGRLAAWLARRADVIVAVSGAVASGLERRGLTAEVVHNGVELPAGRPADRSNGRLVVGTLATVCRRKGSDLFLAASRLVRDGLGEVEFRMVGDLVVGGERPWAERVVADARGQGIVHRSGIDPYEELAEWDVFVLPSRMDPCPLAVLEAMASSLPVVASRVGGIPEEVGDDAGLLVEPEDVEGIAAAVLRLASEPDLRASLGAAARRRVERLFTLERQAEGIDAAYRAALAGNAARTATP